MSGSAWDAAAATDVLDPPFGLPLARLAAAAAALTVAAGTVAAATAATAGATTTPPGTTTDGPSSGVGDSAVRVVFGRNRHIRPPPASRTATMNVGAGQYRSSRVAITTLPMIPPNRAATIEIATPVALQNKQNRSKHFH
uniref:Uncharacterized protein n=1 Tax=Anopheles merus TaxID=30066 RepID=A0A182VAJ0_ANOME